MSVTDNPPTVPPGETAAPSPIRLLKFLALFGFGGTERQVVNLARMLDRSRFDPRFACLRRWGHFLEEIERHRVPVSEYRIHGLCSPGAFRQQLRFAGDIRRQRTQIVHSYNFYANVFAVPAARLAGVPVVIASIRDTGSSLTPAKEYAQRIVCRLADCVLTNAEAIRLWLIGQGYPPEKISVIRNGIDLSRFSPRRDGPGLRQELGLPQRAPLVVLLARLDPLKGIEYFLDAAAAIIRRCPEARFLVVGDAFVAGRQDDSIERDHAYRKALEQRVVQLGLGERVLFTGYRPDVPGLLAEAAVSVLPSLSEGLSNTLLESMAAGVPVVATRVGGNPEAIEDGTGGLLVPPRDPGALAQAICAVLNDDDLARRLGQEARRRVEERFSIERMVRETQDLYTTLLEGKTNRKRRWHRHPGEREEVS